MRPRINPACIDSVSNIFSQEVYTIKGYSKITYYKRCEAIERTTKVAIAKQIEIIICLNGFNFYKIDKDGTGHYIYNPSIDNVTSDKLKRFFIRNGFVSMGYKKLAMAA
jgi:hypothetical protein